MLKFFVLLRCVILHNEIPNGHYHRPIKGRTVFESNALCFRHYVALMVVVLHAAKLKAILLHVPWREQSHKMLNPNDAGQLTRACQPQDCYVMIAVPAVLSLSLAYA